MKNILLISIILCAFSCTNQKKEVILDNQKLLYDSTQSNDKSFSVTIITILKSNNEIEAKDLKNFYIVTKTDTLSLDIKKINHSQSGTKVIEYSSILRQKEKEFGDNTFIDSVKNYEIKNKNAHIFIKKSSDYSISPLIKLWKNNNKNIVE